MDINLNDFDSKNALLGWLKANDVTGAEAAAIVQQWEDKGATVAAPATTLAAKISNFVAPPVEAAEAPEEDDEEEEEEDE